MTDVFEFVDEVVEVLEIFEGQQGTQGPAGPQGPPGVGGGFGDVGIYEMPITQTTAQFTPVTAHFPVTFEVRDESGAVCDEYSVSETLLGDVLLGFDISVKATIRYL